MQFFTLFGKSETPAPPPLNIPLGILSIVALASSTNHLLTGALEVTPAPPPPFPCGPTWCAASDHTTRPSLWLMVNFSFFFSFSFFEVFLLHQHSCKSETAIKGSLEQQQQQQQEKLWCVHQPIYLCNTCTGLLTLIHILEARSGFSSAVPEVPNV